MKYVLLVSLSMCIFFGSRGLLLTNEKSKSFKIFLLFNTLLGLILGGLYLYTIDLVEDNQFLNLYSLLFFVFCIALPPSFYLYIKSLTQSMSIEESLSTSIKHLYPAFFLLVINLFAFVFLNINNEDSDFFNYVKNVMDYANLIALTVVLLSQVIFYLILSIIAYKKYRDNYGNLYSYKEGVNLKWLLSFIIGFFVFIIMIYLVQIGIPQGNIIFGGSILIYVVFINYNAFNQEKIYTELIAKGPSVKLFSVPSISKTIEFQNEGDTNTKNIQKYEWLPNMVEKLEESMQQDKLYKDTSLNLYQLSNHLNSNTKYVSYAINNHFKKNFSSYVNEYRIKEAISLLSDKTQEQFTLEYIAKISGFKSRSSFISAFKKVKETTPSQYKKSLTYD